MYYQTPVPLYINQMINPFLNSIILSNYVKGEGILANREIVIPLIVSLVKNLFYKS